MDFLFDIITSMEFIVLTILFGIFVYLFNSVPESKNKKNDVDWMWWFQITLYMSGSIVIMILGSVYRNNIFWGMSYIPYLKKLVPEDFFEDKVEEVVQTGGCGSYGKNKVEMMDNPSHQRGGSGEIVEEYIMEDDDYETDNESIIM